MTKTPLKNTRVIRTSASYPTRTGSGSWYQPTKKQQQFYQWLYQLARANGVSTDKLDWKHKELIKGHTDMNVVISHRIGALIERLHEAGIEWEMNKDGKRVVTKKLSKEDFVKKLMRGE
jgi:hypothetical protein